MSPHMPHRQLANISNSAKNTNSRMVQIDKNCRKPTHLRLSLARQQPKCDKARWVISRVINVSSETPRLLESNIDDDIKLTVWPFMDKTWHWACRLDRVWCDLWFLDCCTTSRVHVRLWEKLDKNSAKAVQFMEKFYFGILRVRPDSREHKKASQLPPIRISWISRLQLFEALAKHLIFTAVANWRNWFASPLHRLRLIQLRFKLSSICNGNSIESCVGDLKRGEHVAEGWNS